VQGAVAFDPTLAGGDAKEFALPIAVTVSSQERLLPVTDAMRARFPCLAALPIVRDLRRAAWAAIPSPNMRAPSRPGASPGQAAST
jgi:hypothetical protein